MKLRKFLTISCLCFTALQTFGCGPYSYEPSDYYLFRLTPDTDIYNLNKDTWDYYAKRNQDIVNLNITEWQKLVGSNAKSNDVYEVVYKYLETDIARIESLFGKAKSKDTLLRNSFVQHIVRVKDKQALEYLLFAKMCERYRGISIDDWDYPSAEDLKEQEEMLNLIMQKASTIKQNRFSDRYAFQALRAAFTFQNWDLCLKLWNENFEPMKPCSIRTLAEDYIGGLYYRKGDYVKALSYFARTDLNPQNYKCCLSKINEKFTMEEAFAIIYKHDCNALALQYLLQTYGTALETNRSWESYNEPCYLCSVKKSFHALEPAKQKQYMDLHSFCLKAAKDNQVANRAMWQYSAAFISLMCGDIEAAKQETKAGQQMKPNENLSDKLHILYVITEAAGSSFEQQNEQALLQNLRWFEQKIKVNLPKEMTKKGHIEGSFGNWSTYYYNDMLRKLLLGIVIPKYIAEGKNLKTLLLTGYTTELIANLSGYRKHSQEWNEDFSTDIFVMMDTMPVADVQEYVATIYGNSSDSLINYLSSFCYKNKDYYNELIGTKLMREERFTEAAACFEQVKKSYWTSMNIYPYFTYPIFDDANLIRRTSINPKWDYKLKYAQEMSRLKSQMLIMQPSEEKAAVLYRYSLGLIAAEHKFSLTKYGKDCYISYSIYQGNDSVSSEKIDRLLAEAGDMTKDKELSAKCLVARMKMKDAEISDNYWGDNDKKRGKAISKSLYGTLAKLIETKFADTRTFEMLSAQCDTYDLYRQIIYQKR
ncbi:MAG: hypothetical protein LBO06_02815 [Bacteroidales bacterium]|jgi:hypothetical protein|nr:hypothetical protein [Bacteroidales bacterium]